MTTYDLLCFDDLSLDAMECSGPVEELEQDIYHRISTTKGQNIDDEDLGQSISDWLSQPITIDDAAKLLEEEVEKDPRVARSTVSIVSDGDKGYVVSVEAETNEAELLNIEVTV